MKSEGPFTVFAPTDEAFAKIPKADLDALLIDKDKLIAMLSYHVVAGKTQSKNVKPSKVKTVHSSELTIARTSGCVTGDAARNTPADSSVMHVIDTVLIPK